jgi:hypothetical protein
MMDDPSANRPADPSATEPDPRFPSGPWTGYFLQPVLTGRHWMEIRLTFRDGKLSGEGRDRVGAFVMTGRYDVKDGRCSWTKQYLGRHAIEYQGYNEGKGIWGRWFFKPSRAWHGGFHIWPVGSGAGGGGELAEELDVPAAEHVAEPVAAPMPT